MQDGNGDGARPLYSCIYFITPTIHNWYYIFDRHNRWQILTDSLKFCQENKSLKVYAYVFVLNHLHLIIQSPDAIGFIRDFKKFTSKKLIENIKTFDFRLKCGDEFGYF